MILVYSGLIQIQLKLWEAFPDGFGSASTHQSSPGWSRKWDLEAELIPWNRVPGVDVPAGSARMLLAEAQG